MFISQKHSSFYQMINLCPSLINQVVLQADVKNNMEMPYQLLRARAWVKTTISSHIPVVRINHMDKKSESVSCSVMSDSLWPCGLKHTRLLCPWDSPGKNTRVGCHFLLQGIFSTQKSNPSPLHWGWFFTIWATREASIWIYTDLIVNTSYSPFSSTY